MLGVAVVIGEDWKWVTAVLVTWKRLGLEDCHHDRGTLGLGACCRRHRHGRDWAGDHRAKLG